MPDRRRVKDSSHLVDYYTFVCIKQVFGALENSIKFHIGRRGAHV
jgi:hypothetical protein